MQNMGVAACVKHYALNNDEENRHQVNVVVDDRTLHEIYLPAFKAAVIEGGAWASWALIISTIISITVITRFY